jgi:hypothetical protein
VADAECWAQALMVEQRDKGRSRLRKDSEDLAQDRLPRRWVELLHRLAEEEQKRDVSGAEDPPQDAHDR